MKSSEIILCWSCHNRTATQHLSITMELTSNCRITYRLVRAWLCDDCAKAVMFQSTGQRVAEALSAGGEK